MGIMENPSALALIATLFGASGLKITEYLLGSGKVKTDLAAELRKELRDDINGLRVELRQVEKELDEWREKYYKLINNLYESHSDYEELNKVMRNALLVRNGAEDES